MVALGDSPLTYCDHPAVFVHMAMRYLCFGVSTATSATRLSALMGLSGEHVACSSDAGEQLVRVLLSPAPSEKYLFQRSQAPAPLERIRLGVRPGPGAGIDLATLNLKFLRVESIRARRPTLSTSERTVALFQEPTGACRAEPSTGRRQRQGY